LVESQTLPGFCVFGILAVVKCKPEGIDAWDNFDKAAKAKGSDGETLLLREGVEVTHAKIMGKPKTRRTVAPKDVPLFLTVVCGKQALPSLTGEDLLETLVARGMDRDRAKDLLTEQVQKLQEKPEDVAMLAQVLQVLGTPLGAVRHMRTPKRNGEGEGTVFVMSAINLVMAARGCDYDTAKSITLRVFKDYWSVDLEVPDHVKNHEAEGASCTHCYMVQFPGERQRKTPALDVQGACELLCVIPGSDFGAAVRRRAVDALLRVEGGDESLIDRIKANRKFQEYLAQHDPDHPFRAVGEHAERRQAEEAVPEAHRREQMEMELNHTKHMRELELETARKKARLEVARMEIENSKLEAEAAEAVRTLAERARLEEERVKSENAALAARQKEETQQRREAQHEEFRRQRATTISANMDALRSLRPERGPTPLSPRSMLLVEDELRTGLLGRERPDPELGRPLYCSKFLKEELLLTDHAARERAKVFGNDVKEAVRSLFPDYDVSARTNRSVDGHDREPHLYFEAHLPAFRQALRGYLARASPVRDDELTRDGQARRRAEQAASRRDFFGRASA
jgi:hypothetical protein